MVKYKQLCLLLVLSLLFSGCSQRSAGTAL